MSSLFGVNEELKVFKCPQCKEYISSNNDFCPKCSFQIPIDLKQKAIQTEDEDVKIANRKFYKNSLWVGIGLFLLGSFLLVQMLFTGRFFLWSPILTLLGLGEIIYSLNGLYKER